MVRFMRLGSVIKASGRALSTAVGRQQRRAVAPVPVDTADTADHEQLTKKNFAEVQRERHEQARHSVLISCPARINEQKFMKHLSEHGKIASHFFFEFTGTHALVEFVSIESIDSLLSATKFPEEEDTYAVPFKSRFIKVKSQEVQQQFVRGSQQSPVNINQLLEKLRDAESITEQAHVLLENHQLTEESIRLRYLVSSLVSDIATAYFPKATVHPYGSTVNSFGKMGCDLDLFLNLDSMKDVNKKDSGPFVTEYWFRRVSSPRAVQQRVLNVVGECLESFGPGCTQVQKILQARCPLVGFFHQSAGLHCDLTADNRVALRSSELLYIYGNIDSRVRPLVFALRCWARVHGITSSVPGHWITNFSLTTMVLFFLQKRNPPIIPTLDKLKNLADKKDKCIIEDNDCTFVSDLSKIKPSANTESLDTLLIEFMDFYGGFDFSGKCIDIRKGVEKNKPDSFPLYIQNPFERTMNISKNVNNSQLEQFVHLVQESSWILQEQMSKTSVGENKNWGLASILLSRDSQAESSLKKKQTTLRLNNLIDSLNGNNKNRTTTNKKQKPEH